MSRSKILPRLAVRCAATASLALAAAVLGACSADIARLDSPHFNDGAPIPSQPIGGRRDVGAPPPYDNSGWANSGSRNDMPSSVPPPSSSRVASLGDTTAPLNPSHPFDAPKPARAAVAPHPAAVAQRPAEMPFAGGATIEVHPGDTVYGLARKHHVSIAALMEANGLKTPNLRPGQKLTLPSGAGHTVAHSAPAKASPARATAPAMASASAPAVAAAAPTKVPADWTGSYTIKSGDSLFAIARAHKITVAELQQVNGIADALKVRPGAVLRVPASVETPVAAAQETAPSAAPGVHILNAPNDAAPTPSVQPTKVAGIGPVAIPTQPAPAAEHPASAPVAAAPGKFLWPAKGAVIAGFGNRPDGAHNDGINISVPAGTDIHAAEAGTVAYAGSEIKAYGNLVLIRHEGGWVTAYAHASEILVKRGDTIKRGQVIAKAGKTGSVDQPQVHFELRQGSKPIDPMPHMTM